MTLKGKTSGQTEGNGEKMGYVVNTQKKSNYKKQIYVGEQLLAVTLWTACILLL